MALKSDSTLEELQIEKKHMLVDTHAHLNFPQFKDGQSQIVHNAEAAGIGMIVNVGTNLGLSRAVVETAREHSGVFATVGFHPHDVEKVDTAGLEALARLVGRNKVVGVGETGLDFFRDYAPHDRQEEVFKWHIRLAKSAELPLVIHSRGAEDEVLEILDAEHAGEVGGVLHCFGGTAEQAIKAQDLGFYIGMGGTVTFKNSNSMGVAVEVRGDKLLLETDCPYLAPVPFRGKRNEPAYVNYVAAAISSQTGESLEALSDRTTENAIRLFNLSAHP
jgi:TatD DNase family protein